MSLRSAPITALDAEALRLMPHPYQAFDRMIYAIGKQNEEDAKLCYRFPPGKDDWQ